MAMLTNGTAQQGTLGLRAGDVVEVLGVDKILATLDENGEFESLPFMPEMVRFCGQRLTVQAVAHKLCDTIDHTGFRRMERSVHLQETRCDGAAHGGCETECLLYWKEAWLRRVEPGSGPIVEAPTDGRIHLPLLIVATTRRTSPDDDEVRYSCQATEMSRAAPTCLPVRNLGQYVQDVTSKNASPRHVGRALFIALFNAVQRKSAKLPERLRIRGGLRWYFLAGRAEGRTPTSSLDLQPGELVRIKPKDEILATVNSNLLNRGLGFDEEMSEHCGKVARVRRRAERVIDEKSGRMLTMKTACIVLDDIVCEGRYSQNCPRRFYSFWREIWLERVDDRAGDKAP